MKTKIFLFTIPFLISLLIFSACKKSETEDPVTTITGKITDVATYNGIAATVTLNPGNKTQTTKEDGKYEFEIPDTTITYSVTASVPDYKEQTINYIQVKFGKKTTVDVALTKLNPQLSFTAPYNGISWHIETQQTISWNSSDLTGNVKVELIKAGIVHQTIAASIANNGAYQWTLPNNLSAGTDYKIRISSVTNTSISFESNSFAIATMPLPVATTQAATNLSSTTATLNALVNANGQSTTVTFECGLTTSYGSVKTASQSPATGTADANMSADITGLTASTTYHFRVKAVSEVGTVYGADMSFTTSPPSYENIYEVERNGPSTSLTTLDWSYYMEHTTANKQYFIINGAYSGTYAGYNAASYKNYDWDLFELSFDKNDEVTIEVLKGTTSGLWGMSMNIIMDMKGGSSVGTKPTITGNTYKWTIFYNANETISDAYLIVNMPDNLINTGPYSYQLKVTINKK
jgi:hypothetical protein